MVRDSEYDYDSANMEKNGIFFDSYEILPFTETACFVFGIAWINECNEKNDVETWFGADPVGFLSVLEKQEGIIEVNEEVI